MTAKTTNNLITNKAIIDINADANCVGIDNSLIKFKKLFGFSILELTFSLVAISVFLAAFAPVISSRFASENEMIFNSGELVTSLECDSNFPNPYGLVCTLCYHEASCVTCGGNCPSGMKKNVSECTCE